MLGSYRIESPLGAGGMGEVYRATDTRLGREVAVKILPEHLASFAEARERFEREARVISSLSHPGICTLFDIGTQDGSAYLVMELLEGETLAARLLRGPLKLDETLRLGAQVADALDKAHRKGIIHRDLKPANLMLTKSGVKVLDFGVAKLREDPSGSGMLTGTGILPTRAPTRTTPLSSPLTTEGAIVGTMQYMAPEQLEGKLVDHRADIFSLGAVLYEMMTAKRVFEGASQASVIAAILEREPRPVSQIVPACPAALDRTIARCLAKDPDERWQSALDIKSDLEWIGQQSGITATQRAVSEASAGKTASSQARPMSAAMMAAAVVVVGAATFAMGWFLHRPVAPPARLMRASLVMPRGSSLDTDNSSIALSPDGTVLAYAGRQGGTRGMLFVRPLDSLTAQALAGTEGASYPTWSPDGRQLAFFADRKLKKVPANGGTVQSICEAEDGRGATWGIANVIVFAPRPMGGLSVVSASGGSPEPITTAASEGVTHRNPHFLPDGRRLLFFSGNTTADRAGGIHSLDLSTKKVEPVLTVDSEGIYIEPGYLAFVREGNLMAQRIDPATLRTTGEAVPIAEGVQFNTFRRTGTYAFSGTGLMLFQSGAIQADSRLTWYDIEGKPSGTVGEPAIFWQGMDISPDGRRAVATVRHADGGSDLWMYDLVRGLGTRFTLGESNGLLPYWSPDGRQVAFTDGGGRLYIKAADGSTPPRTIYSAPSGSLNPTSWSRDGSKIFYYNQAAKTGTDLYYLPLPGATGSTAAPEPVPFLASSANESDASLSPDGRWIVHTSDESGRVEVYVRNFPGPGGKWQVSTQGASGPCGWLGDGKEIVYIDLEGKVFAVPVTPNGAALEVGAPRPLFGGQVLQIVTGAFAPDGKRVLGATTLSGDVGPVLTLVTNWASALESK